MTQTQTRVRVQQNSVPLDPCPPLDPSTHACEHQLDIPRHLRVWTASPLAISKNNGRQKSSESCNERRTRPAETAYIHIHTIHTHTYTYALCIMHMLCILYVFPVSSCIIHKHAIAQGYGTDLQGLSRELSQSQGLCQGQVIHPRKRFYFVSDLSPCHRRVVSRPGHGPCVDVVQWAA